MILAALGCGYGMAWRDWSALDAALLLYADMLVALLADLLKTGVAPAAVRRAAAEDAEEEHCWSLLVGLRFRGIIERDDIRRAGRTPQVAGVSSATWHPIEGDSTRSCSVAGMIAFAVVIILLIGAVIEGSMPADRPETRFLSGTGSIDNVEWQLELRMKGPGLGYGVTFDLLVFHPETGIDVHLPSAE